MRDHSPLFIAVRCPDQDKAIFLKPKSVEFDSTETKIEKLEKRL